MVHQLMPSTWTQGLDVLSRLFGEQGSTDFELYEESEEFVLTIDVPGFETNDIQLARNDGVLNVAAEHVDDERSRKQTSPLGSGPRTIACAGDVVRMLDTRRSKELPRAATQGGERR